MWRDLLRLPVLVPAVLASVAVVMLLPLWAHALLAGGLALKAYGGGSGA